MFLVKLDHVLLLKCMHIFVIFESQICDFLSYALFSGW